MTYRSKAGYAPIKDGNTERDSSSSQSQREGPRYHTAGSLIWKPILFTAAFIGCTFTAFSIVRSERYWESMQLKNKWVSLRDMFYNQQPVLVKQDKETIWTEIKDFVNYHWSNQSEALKIANSLIALNGVIFLMWQLPTMSRFMHRHFVHDPLSSKLHTLVTSNFSHQAFMHFAFNMYALHGFMPSLQIKSGMSWEQTLAFYVSAGAFSAIGSHLISVAFGLRGLRAIIPSLGASGGLWAVLVGTSIVSPDSGVGIIFLPGINFTMSELIPCMVLLDVFGLIRGWKTLDHAGHLAGALFGFLYIKYGRPVWNDIQLRLYQNRLKESRKTS